MNRKIVLLVDGILAYKNSAPFESNLSEYITFPDVPNAKVDFFQKLGFEIWIRDSLTQNAVMFMHQQDFALVESNFKEINIIDSLLEKIHPLFAGKDMNDNDYKKFVWKAVQENKVSLVSLSNLQNSNSLESIGSLSESKKEILKNASTWALKLLQSISPKIIISSELSVDQCNQKQDSLFVFGDNIQGWGKAGQAIIRDCKNSFGIPTKYEPSMKEQAFFSDTKEEFQIVLNAFLKLREKYISGKYEYLVFPKNGLGTGLAQLQDRSPKILALINSQIELFKNTQPNSEKKIIIAGSRNFENYEYLEEQTKNLIKSLNVNNALITIISGKAQGADTLGERFAKENKLSLLEFPADWEKYGKKAGYLRNAEMANHATHLLAFWNGSSPGTKHMIDIATQKNLTVKVCEYPPRKAIEDFNNSQISQKNREQLLLLTD